MVSQPLPETCCEAPPTVWLSSGHAAYIGPSLQLDAHSGSVDCFALGLDAPFTLRSGDGLERRARSALIPARTRHQVVAATERGFKIHDHSLHIYADCTKNPCPYKS